MILNARAENGSGGRRRALELLVALGVVARSTGGMSAGDGMYQHTASSSGCTPLFLNAVPLSTGTTPWLMQALRSAARISSAEISSSPRYFSMMFSSVSDEHVDQLVAVVLGHARPCRRGCR